MLNFSFRQQVFAGFAASVILVFVVGLLSYRNINQAKEDASMVDHTENVIKTASNLLQLMTDAETGTRGYAATNNKDLLEPYNKALLQISGNLDQLRKLVRDNYLQIKRIDTLISLVEIRLNNLKEQIDARDKKGLEYMIQNQMFVNGKHYMDRIRAVLNHVEETENHLLALRKANSEASSSQALFIIITGSLIFLLIIIVLFYYIQRTFVKQKKIEIEISSANARLETVLAENEKKNWVLTGLSLLNEKMQGEQNERELASNVIAAICNYTNALTGTVYLFNESEEQLEYCSSYAFHDLGALKKTIKLTEGRLGQAAVDQKVSVIKGKLNDKLELATSVIREELTESFVFPFFFDKKIKGVIEIAFRDELNENVQDYILAVADIIGITFNTAQARAAMQELFEKMQQQAEELSAQQEEMRVTNEELMSKTEKLQSSEEELIAQQEELRAINAELEEKAGLLEERNEAIEEARQAIKLKAEQLETTGKYKSEFLANMSHELRTPLNSILVLARILKDNKTTNLSEDQIKYASVIFNAGNDLLTLIDDILDLAKMESGKMEMNNEEVSVADIVDDMEMLFAEVARNKKIKYTSNIGEVPQHIFTDKMRIQQVIKNLLSNAFKFTDEKGSVAINVIPGKAKGTISFCIKDTGIGIPKEKQSVIFEAFQQADGSTNRKFGGTGLGLSISRELAALLGGTITMQSEPGLGSEFILTIPVEINVIDADLLPGIEAISAEPQFLTEARRAALTSDRGPLVIIVEDDKNFAGILQDYARNHGFNPVILNDGTNAVSTIEDQLPDAVILDIKLPGKDGWQILKELKLSGKTAHIPVHLMSAGDAETDKIRKEGAVSFLKKPIDPNMLNNLFSDILRQNEVVFKKILIAEDRKLQSPALKELFECRGISVDRAFDGESVFRMLNENNYQCLILDLVLPDIAGLDLLDKIKKIDRFVSLPVIINTAMELDKISVNRLMQYANALVVKTKNSSNRLIDEVNLFLNKIGSEPSKQNVLNPIGKAKTMNIGKKTFKGKKVLLVDDDLRNVFALSSALKMYDFVIETANDGEEAIAQLENINDVDIVLMDIMMPKMDGYEAIRYIRSQRKWTKLPIIALTAKAMSDDRAKCIAAGADDYITKPVDMDKLISLMQLWLEN
jgi:signal transduction histidine kinase/DNA-binding response OmpR family regulator/CHASE3 domain sensor protein